MHGYRPGCWTLGTIVLLLLTHGLAAHGPQTRGGGDQDAKELELRVRPRATQSPGTIRVTALVARHSTNRDITIEADSGSFFRSSSEAIDGEAGPTRVVRVFDGLPPGTYEVSARLERSDGTELLDVLTVEVFGSRRRSMR